MWFHFIGLGLGGRRPWGGNICVWKYFINKEQQRKIQHGIRYKHTANINWPWTFAVERRQFRLLRWLPLETLVPPTEQHEMSWRHHHICLRHHKLCSLMNMADTRTTDWRHQMTVNKCHVTDRCQSLMYLCNQLVAAFSCEIIVFFLSIRR